MAAVGKDIGDTKSATYEKTWDQKLEWGDFVDGEDTVIRINGPWYVMLWHWIMMGNGNQFPCWCPKWDISKEELNSEIHCPLHDDMGDEGQIRYLTTAIFRNLQSGPKARAMPCLPINVPHTVAKNIRKINERKGKVSDPENGSDILINYNARAQGTDKWSVQWEGHTKLTEKESDMLVDLSVHIPDYSDPKVHAAEARKMKKSLAYNGYYVIKLNNGIEGPKGFKRSFEGEPYIKYPELIIKGKNNQKGPHKDILSGRDDDSSESAPVSPPTRSAQREEKKEEAPKEQPKAVVETPKVTAPVEEKKEEKKEPAKEATPTPASTSVADKPVEIKSSSTSTPSAVPPEYVAWATDNKIEWNADTNKPGCFGVYASKKKCFTCPFKKDCVKANIKNP